MVQNPPLLSRLQIQVRGLQTKCCTHCCIYSGRAFGATVQATCWRSSRPHGARQHHYTRNLRPIQEPPPPPLPLCTIKRLNANLVQGTEHPHVVHQESLFWLEWCCFSTGGGPQQSKPIQTAVTSTPHTTRTPSPRGAPPAGPRGTCSPCPGRGRPLRRPPSGPKSVSPRRTRFRTHHRGRSGASGPAHTCPELLLVFRHKSRC